MEIGEPQKEHIIEPVEIPGTVPDVMPEPVTEPEKVPA